MRHCGLKLRKRHLLFNGALHPHETDPELVLEKFTDRPYPPVPEVVDIIDLALTGPQIKEVSKYLYYVLVRKNPCF
ncbi:hypothetical protein BMS3Bbin09_00300 [bacterium BMS3Bbin09]|nr:hypothetical protein BMS3Bbin09_00300 [bacterium BMS3Bbin09]